MNPFFSVVISIYNKETYILNTLQSVVDQTYENFEIIAVNDGSTDRSLEILKQFEDSRIIIINQENHGASYARNQGMAITKGRFVALLDGDDLWDKTFLSSMHDLINKYEDQSVFTAAIAHMHHKKIIPVHYSFTPTETVSVLNYFKASSRHSILSGSSAVFKKDILETTGVFDTEIKSGQDTDLWIRIGLHFPIIFLNKVLVYYVQNQNSLSNSTTNLSAKPKFDNYGKEEKENIYLKKFLDNNRFSMALLAKLNNETEAYNYYHGAISKTNLSMKRKLLLKTPIWLVKLFLRLRKANNVKTYYPILEDKKSS
mgnify:CR=1 FL=1